MHLGIYHLRLRPDQFWVLTPYEIGVMLGFQNTAPPLNANELSKLMRRYPDIPKRKGT